MASKNIDTLIRELKRFDNAAGYNLPFEEVEKPMEGTVKALVDRGEEVLDQLHPLLRKEDTWSCYFSLKAIRGIRSERSVPFLIDYLVVNEESRYYENCEEAMFALSEIGAPAVDPLLATVEDAFARHKYYYFLVGALNSIADDRAFRLIRFTLEDYIAHPARYAEWFDLVHYVLDLEKQGRKETMVPLLKAILDMDHLDESERIEVRDTISVIEDPEGWEAQLNRDGERLKALLEAAENELPEKVGKNQPCPCGSGNKYKYCCLKKNEVKKNGGKKHIKRLN